jgi:hypothetical protein
MSDFLTDEGFLSELKKPLPTNPLMFAGWAGCVEWASKHPMHVAMYKHDTGATAFDRTNRSDMLVFTDWVTEFVWGDEDAPPYDD